METTQLEFGGLRSSVFVDGSDVPHYGVQYDEGAKEVTSWIVSETDKPFAVHMKLMNRIPGENFAIYVYLDGHNAKGISVRPQESSVIYVKSKRVSDTETRQFMFGSLELSDDDTLIETSSTKALGEIKLLFYRVGTMVPSNKDYTPAPQAQKVHERAKKGLAHSVKYGGTQLDPLPPTTTHFTPLNNTLIARHIIRYRPLAMLQANGIVPYVSANNGQNPAKSPSPAPGPSSRTRQTKKRKALGEPGGADLKPAIDLGDDDYQDIIRKEHELKEQLMQLQQKKAQHQGRQAKKVKQEEMKPILPGEIIDLTN